MKNAKIICGKQYFSSRPSLPVPHKPLLSSLSSLSTILRIGRAGPVTLLAGPNIDDVGSRAGDVSLDGHVLPCAADLH